MNILETNTRVTAMVSCCTGSYKVLLGKIAVVIDTVMHHNDCVYYTLEWDDTALDDDYGCLPSTMFKVLK